MTTSSLQRHFFKFFLCLFLGPVCIFLSPLKAYSAIDSFAFVSPTSAYSGVTYSTVAGSLAGNSVTFNVQAQSSPGVVDGSFNDVVTVGLYDTTTTQFSDPSAVFLPLAPNPGPTETGAAVALQFKGGLLNFAVTLTAGSNSEQVSIGDATVTSGAAYPGFTSGFGYIAQGYSTTYYLEAASQTQAPAVYAPMPTPGPTDLLLLNPNIFMESNDFGVTVLNSAGVTNSDCFAVTGITGGYAAGGAGITPDLYFYRAVNTNSAPITYEIILDYGLSAPLTDYNNPRPIDTVWMGSSLGNFAVYGGGGNASEVHGGAFYVSGPTSFPPFMTNGQIIVRVWTGAAPVSNTAYMEYATTSDPGFCTVNIPYSSSNVLPVKASLSPAIVLDGGVTTLQYTLTNQYSSPISYLSYAIPPNNPASGQYWNVSVPAFLPGHPGTSLTVASEPTGSQPGTVIFNSSGGGPITINESVTINMGATCSGQSNNWSFPILQALTGSNLSAPTNSVLAVIQTLGAPDTPLNFTAAPINFVAPGTGGAVSLTWSQSVSQSPQGYIISRSGGAAFTPVTLTAPVSVYYVDSTALNLTAYNYSIVSYNAVTQSGAASAGPVTAFVNPVTITALSGLTGGTTIRLNWVAAVATPGAYPVTGYQIWRDTQASMATAVSLTSVAGTTYDDKTIVGGNQYYYEIASVDSQYAVGAPSTAHISGLSSAQATGFPLGNPPTGLTAALTPGPSPVIQFSWTAPNTAAMLNGPATAYQVQISPDGVGSSFVTVTAPTALYNDSLVTVGHFYVAQVSALDGAGVLSNPAGPVTGYVGPSAPSTLLAAAGPAAITLTWPAVANGPGETIASYVLYQNGTAIGTPVPAVPVSVTAIDVTPLQGTNYIYQVASVDTNSVQGGLSSAVTSALPPLAPQNFGVTVQQTGVSFNMALTWAAPASSANVTSYNIRYSGVNSFPGTFYGGFPFSPQPVTFSLPVSSAGTTEFFWIRGVDPGGAGVTAGTAVQLPPTPPTGTGVSPSSNAITISWNAIANENVSKYTIYRAPLPSGTPVVAVGTATPGTAISFTDSGPLTLGINYVYYVTATDPGSGITILGGESLPSASVTSALVPPVPIGLTAALNAASDNVTLTWTSQLSGDPNLQSYTLSRTINGGAPSILQTAAASVVTYTDTGITSANAGQTILYYLLATNNVGGASPQEGPVGLQVPPNPPGTPTPSASSSAITVNWTPNGNDGNGASQNVSQYTVYRNSGSGFVSIGTAAVPPFIDNGSVNGPLAYGSTYTYELTATNPGSGTTILGGTSAFSAPSAPWGLAPATPAGLAVSLLDNLNDTAVTWTGITDPSVTAVYALAATVNNPALAVTATLANSAVSQYFAAQTGDATYYYWVEAVNPYGASAPEGPVFQLSYPATVNFAPVSLGPNQATVLSWVTVGKGDVTSYVESREVSGSNNFTQSQTITAAGLQLPVTLALPFTSGVIYDYEITAINTTGTGPNSNLQPFSYLPTAPVSVTAVSGTSNTGVTVNLSWSDPVSLSQGVTAYTVYKATAPAGPFTAAVSGLTGTNYSDSGVSVVGGTVYYYLIAADDNLGQESATLYSNAVAVTAFALPNPPTGPSATAYNGSVTLSWSTVLSTTYPVSIYQIQRVGGGVTTILNSTSSPYGDTSVTNGVTYIYTLQTEDSHGNLSSATAPVNALPLAPPSAPTSLNIGLGDTELLLSWNAGTQGTLPIGTYQIYRSTGGAYSLLTTVSGTTTGYLDQPLTDGSSYSYYMVSVDTSGSTSGLDVSSNSATVSGIPAVGAVNPPSNLAAAAGVAQVILTWSDSITVTGPAAVTGYSIFQETGSSGFVSIGTLAPTGGSSEAITETGLTNGDLYSYYLVGHSSTNTSADSATVLGIPSAPPAAPTPIVGTDGINKDVLNWGASPAQGSVTIKQYVITQAVLPGASGTLATTAGSVTFYTDSNPANDGQTVVYQVEAVNSNGTTGALSAAVTDYPYASFPVTIASHSAGTAAVTLNFTQTTPLSWAPLTQLDILRAPALGGASVAITTGNLASPYIDNTATTGTLYVYTMEAVDNKGHISALSNAVTDGPSNPPAAPATFIATAGSQQVLLDWPASAPVSGAIPVSFYLLTIDGAAPVTVPAAQTWYLDSGLGNGVGVTVSLQAVDGSGVTVGNHASTVVGPVIVTTNQNALNPPTGLTATTKTGNNVLLNWTPPNDEGRVIKSFNVFRSGSFVTAVGSLLATVNNPALAPVTTYMDNSAIPGTTYYYVVQAVYAQPATALGPTASPNSNNAMVTTPAGAAGVPPVTVGVMAFNANLLKPLTGQQLGIYFVAPDSGPVELDIYNISGHPIRALYATAIADVAVNVTWDGKDRNGSWAASGVYLIEIKAPGLHQIKKVLVVK